MEFEPRIQLFYSDCSSAFMIDLEIGTFVPCGMEKVDAEGDLVGSSGEGRE